jgi:hypothetical protein
MRDARGRAAHLDAGASRATERLAAVRDEAFLPFLVPHVRQPPLTNHGLGGRTDGIICADGRPDKPESVTAAPLARPRRRNDL